MKKKIILALGLVLTLASCSNDDYQSQRHPEANQTSKETIQYTKKHDSNEDVSNEAVLKEASNNLSNENTQENTQNEQNTEEIQNQQNQENEETEEFVGGTFKVDNITNMRSQTSTDSDIVAQLLPENTVEKIGEEGEWSKVRFGSYEGYILTELLVPVN